MSITFGRVPHPTFYDHPFTKAEGVGQNDLGQRTVKGVVWHRMIGTLWGTDGYFASPSVPSLTDYGLGVTATDGADNDGKIIRWNNPLGRQSGWASGPVSSAYGDGAAFVEKYGINGVNRDQASIEISGNYDTPLSAGARQSIAALTAYWADQYQIPWDQFPVAPQDGFSFVRWHQEFTIGTGKVCPGKVVMDATPELIEMTRAILKQYQTGVTPTPEPSSQYAKPITYPWLTDDDGSTVRTINRAKVYPLALRYRAVRETARKQATGANTKLVGPPIVKGESFDAGRVYRSSGKTWVLTKYGTRVAAEDLSPLVKISESGVVSVRYD